MKTTLTGYIAPSLYHLKQLTSTIENPLLVHNLRTWYLPDPLLDTNTIDVVTTPVGKFQAIPVNANNELSYQHTLLNITTSTYTLNLGNLPRCIELDLDINTLLQITNAQRYTKYLIKINFNNYVIQNLADILDMPITIDWSYFLTNYESLLIEIEYINNIICTVLFAEPKSPSVIDYVAHTSNIIFNTNLWTDLVDSSVNAYTASTSGSVSHEEGLLLNTNRVSYTVDNAFILNEIDFTIETFIRFTDSTNYGSIFSRWSDTSKQFWLRIDNDKNLLVSFNEGTAIVTLSYDLTSHLAQTLDYLHIVTLRSFNIYKLFINGVLVDSAKSTPFITTSTAKVIIGKLENATLAGDVANTSFNGIIREIKVCKSIKNNYNFKYTYPRNAYGTDVIFLIQNSLVEKRTNTEPSFVSTVNTQSLLGTGNRRMFDLGEYSNQILNKKHHVEYDGDAIYNISGDCTIEGWIKNYASNTRGTIIYYGDATNFNFHVGIYDSALLVTAKNNALSLTSAIDVPEDEWVHFAYVRQGTDNRIYINGIYAGNITSSEPLNFYGTTLPMCIKRSPSQNGVEADLNTSLYPSKSHIDIEGLRIVKQALYSGTDTVLPNFLLPGEFIY